MAVTSNPSSTGGATPGGSSTVAPASAGDLAQPKGTASNSEGKEPIGDVSAPEETGPTHVAVFHSLGGKEERKIVAKDFEDNAILDHGLKAGKAGELHWRPENNFVVDVSHLSEEAREVLGKIPNIKIKSKGE